MAIAVIVAFDSFRPKLNAAPIKGELRTSEAARARVWREAALGRSRGLAEGRQHSARESARLRRACIWRSKDGMGAAIDIVRARCNIDKPNLASNIRRFDCLERMTRDRANRRVMCRVSRELRCKSPDLIYRSTSGFAIHLAADNIGEADSILSRTRALLAPAKPALRILDRVDPLAKLTATR